MSVIRSKNWPLAPKDRGWDVAAAEDRIRRWAGWAGGPDKENVDWEKYRSCFLWYDSENPENFTSYKFAYVDIIDGEPHVVFRALVAIIAVLNGARGGTNIPSEDREGVYREAAKQYRRFDEEPPELKRSLFDIEHRAFPLQEIRIEGDAQPKIVGYAAVFNSYSEDLGRFREIIRPGAFRKTIQEADVRALVNHDPNYVLGRTRSGTLTLREDPRGLAVEITPPGTQWARDLMTSMRRGDIDQMSFGFKTIRDRWQSDEEGNVIRELLEVQLFDVSVVTFPAYPATEAQVRSAIAELQASIEALRSYLPAEPVQGGHSADAGDGKQGQGSRLAILRKRLEIAEKAI